MFHSLSYFPAPNLKFHGVEIRPFCCTSPRDHPISNHPPFVGLACKTTGMVKPVNSGVKWMVAIWVETGPGLEDPEQFFDLYSASDGLCVFMCYISQARGRNL